MSHKVLTFVEQRGGEIKKSSLEALSLGRRLAEEAGGTLAAVVAGQGIAGLADRIAAQGAEEVFVADAEMLQHYSTEGYAAAAAQAVEKSGAQMLVFAASAMGKDLAPRLAARLEWTYLADVTGAEVAGDRLTVTRPQYAGKAEWKLAAAAAGAVLTARPNVFAAAPPAEGASANSVALDVSGVSPRARTVEVKTAGEGTIDVAEADIIVAAGRGLKGPENMPLVFDLAKELGAAVGASRAIVDADWISHDHQVGQTGKTVGPSLYFAVGVSGAIQHLAGMRTSKRIVAVNKDPDAPIFKEADYGLVADALEVLPLITAEVKKAKGA
jgi:electron transfer flavoprotein alpha subunit